MASWLKLVGTVNWRVGEHWVKERSDLLREIRFGDAHPPTPIRQGDHLAYHAVGDRRLIAVVEVRSAKARYDTSDELERPWPWILDVRVLLKVGRVSQGPSTDLLGLTDDFAYQSFLRLAPAQYEHAVQALREAGAR